MSKYSQYNDLLEKHNKLLDSYSESVQECVRLEKKYVELEHRWATDPIMRRYLTLKKEFDDLEINYNKLVADRFEHEYRNRPSMRCNCCPVHKKDDTPKSEHDFSITLKWNSSTETWDKI